MLEISWWSASGEKLGWSYCLIEREYWTSREDLLKLQSSHEEQVLLNYMQGERVDGVWNEA